MGGGGQGGRGGGGGGGGKPGGLWPGEGGILLKSIMRAWCLQMVGGAATPTPRLVKPCKLTSNYTYESIEALVKGFGFGFWGLHGSLF